MIIIKYKQNIVTKQLNFRVSVQKINTTNSVKYLGVYLNDSLTWEKHFKSLIPKLYRTIGLFPEVRHCRPNFLFKAIYYSFFNSYFTNASEIRGLIKHSFCRI